MLNTFALFAEVKWEDVFFICRN